mgnify:CR=1 FL=1
MSKLLTDDSLASPMQAIPFLDDERSGFPSAAHIDIARATCIYPLCDHFHEAFPPSEWDNLVCLSALLKSIVNSGSAKAVDIWRVHQCNPAEFKIVLFKVVFRFFHYQSLEESPGFTTLSGILFWLNNKIQHGTDSYKDPASSGQCSAVSNYSSKRSTSPKKAGECKYVSHPAEKPLLNQHIANRIACFKNCFLFSSRFSNYWVTGIVCIFHFLNPLPRANAFIIFFGIVRITREARWSSGGHPYRWYAWVSSGWIPVLNLAFQKHLHGVSPLQNVNEDGRTFSLELLLKKRAPFLVVGDP